MNNFDKIESFLKKYLSKYSLQLNIKSLMSTISVDNSEGRDKQFISKHNDLQIISMDKIAHDGMRIIKYENTRWEKDSPASVDAFLVDKNGTWYFIEFKNQKIKNTKEKCIEKSYANIYWLFDIIFEMQAIGELITFNYTNPIDFVKHNCEFILVIYDDSDPNQINKIREANKAGLPMPEGTDFLTKLESYIFKRARVMNETQFDDIFVKNFTY